MAIPKSVVKISKNGVEYTSSVDRAAYTIQELTRAALRDVGRFAVREARKIARRRTGKGRYAIQYWARKKEGDLQIGYKYTHRGFPLSFFELGVNGLPKDAPITQAVEQNISTIREIEGKYLSAIESENNALGLISGNDDKQGGEENS